MAGKRDQYAISLRLSQDEDAWIRAKAASLGIDISEWIRKCIAYGAPILDGNTFSRRVELQDAINAEKSR